MSRTARKSNEKESEREREYWDYRYRYRCYKSARKTTSSSWKREERGRLNPAQDCLTTLLQQRRNSYLSRSSLFAAAGGESSSSLEQDLVVLSPLTSSHFQELDVGCFSGARAVLLHLYTGILSLSCLPAAFTCRPAICCSLSSSISAFAPAAPASRSPSSSTSLSHSSLHSSRDKIHTSTRHRVDSHALSNSRQCGTDSNSSIRRVLSHEGRRCCCCSKSPVPFFTATPESLHSYSRTRFQSPDLS